MSQIFLFTGENAFELLEEKRRWITEFEKKHGGENLSFLDAKSLKFPSLIDEASAMPFIAEKRLIIVDGIPALEKGQLSTLQDAMHPSNIILFVEMKPDKRLSVTKELLAAATIKTFAPVKGAALLRWAMEYTQKYGSTLPQRSAEHLLSVVGENQMLLNMEIRKLATHAYGAEITKEHIRLLTVLSEEQAVWKLMDLIAARRTEKALQFAEELLQKGENAHALWSRLLWIIAQIVPVVSASPSESPAAVAKQTGVPFPTVRTLQPFVRSLDRKKLQDTIRRIAEADIGLKTGIYKATAESPEELHALIDDTLASVSSL